jgi:hypothetical protein
VDGAVVMTKRFEIVGFGGEISGLLPPVRKVRHAPDLEAARTVVESTEGVGTRHRSAYRMAAALPGAVGGGQPGRRHKVRHEQGRHPTYWDHA